MPRSWARAMTSGGGGPSAFAIRRAGWASATSTCCRATECSQPSTPSPAGAPSGSGGTPSLSSVSSTNCRCRAGIRPPRSAGAPSVGSLAGITTSTPYGRPPVFASIHRRTASRSAGSLKRTQPSTPSPPARLIAAATCSDGLKPTMGCSMPSRSHSVVRTVLLTPFSLRHRVSRVAGRVAVRPPVVGLPGRPTADGLDEPDAARRLVAGDLATDVGLDRRQVGGPPLPQLHQGRHPLPEPFVGDADDQRVEHVGMGLQRALHLLGEDLLAPGVDARVAAAEQRYRAVGLDPRQVAGHRIALP